MNILFITNELIGGDVAYQLTKEGHQVKLFIKERGSKHDLDGLVEKTNYWRHELPWVGKDGLIIFDDVGYGKVQDELRHKGFSVFGGCEKADLLETNRQYGKELLSHHGLKTLPSYNFDSISDAIGFVERNRGRWVVKQNGHASKGFNYVGHFPDGRDVINVLENYKKFAHYRSSVITLQEFADGIEIGVGRYFNGKDWAGPIEINIEHKKLFPGDLGPTTSEMGTLAWYDDNEENRLFTETLAPIKEHLEKIKYKGDIDVNCIVNEQGVFPLEVTARMGTPIIHLHSELHTSPWGTFLKEIADGKPSTLEWKKGFGIVVLIAVPPFPYAKQVQTNSSFSTTIHFSEKLLADGLPHIHFEEVRYDTKSKQYIISDTNGYPLYITGMGETVKEARHAVYRGIKEIYIPKMFYRNDIGLKFMEHDEEKLRNWGYL